MRHPMWVLLLSLAVPAAAVARVEITPQIGYRAGGVETATGIVCVQAPCPSFAESEDDLLVGVAVDVPFGEGFQFEISASYQPTALAFSDGPGGPPNRIPKVDLDVTHLHAGVLKSWQLSRIEPFVVLGAGLSRIESGRGLAVGGFDLERFSASLGAGVKIGLGAEKRFGVRFEVRGFWVDTPDAFMDGHLEVTGGDFTQIQTTTGLTFKI